MYKVTTLFTGPEVAGGGINELYFADTAGTAAQAHAAVRTFWTALGDHMRITVQWTVLGEVEEVDAASGSITGVTSTDQFASSGNSSGEPLPPATQGLIRWRTGFYFSGREIRGRTFIPGMLEGSSTNGAPASTALTTFNNAAAGLVGATNAELVVYSRTHGTAAPAISGTAWSKWAQLRSRRD